MLKVHFPCNIGFQRIVVLYSRDENSFKFLLSQNHVITQKHRVYKLNFRKLPDILCKTIECFMEELFSVTKIYIYIFFPMTIDTFFFV